MRKEREKGLERGGEGGGIRKEKEREERWKRRLGKRNGRKRKEAEEEQEEEKQQGERGVGARSVRRGPVSIPQVSGEGELAPNLLGVPERRFLLGGVWSSQLPEWSPKSPCGSLGVFHLGGVRCLDPAGPQS